MSISCKFFHKNKIANAITIYNLSFGTNQCCFHEECWPVSCNEVFLSLQCHFNAFMHLKECKQLQEFLQLKVIEECLKQLHHVVYIFRSKYQKNNIKSKRK